jgi:sodium-dependent phosphate cotransporter
MMPLGGRRKRRPGGWFVATNFKKPVSLRPPKIYAGTADTGFRILFVLFLLFVFLVGVKGLGDGFKMLGKDLLESFFLATSNPFVGLMVGVLATTLVQSSSVTTAMIVGLVAAPADPLPLANAIPMIMGANIGTTVTNSLVSMGHIGRPDEFRRAFSVATCHDFFNFMAVAVLLPVELATGILGRTAAAISGALMCAGGVEYHSPFKAALKTTLAPVKDLANFLFEDSSRAQAIVIVFFSVAAIFTALTFIVKTMRKLLATRVEAALSKAFKMPAIVAMALGALLTMAVQSSSITTSLLVPLAGAGVITLRQAFPLTLGANIGTTVTALLASMAVSGVNARAGLTIALVHLLFNLAGTLLIYPFPMFRRIPLLLAEKLADFSVQRRRWAIVYVLLVFFGLPALFAFLNR